MTRGARVGWAALAALSVLAALIILLNAISPEIPPGLGPNDQYITRSEAWPLIFYLAVPVTIVIVALAGVCIIGVAKLFSQYSTLFVVLAGVAASLFAVTLYLLLSGAELRLVGLYAVAALVGAAPSVTFALAAGLPWWVKRDAGSTRAP